MVLILYSLFTFPIFTLFSKFHPFVVLHNGSLGGESLSSNKCGKGRVEDSRAHVLCRFVDSVLMEGSPYL